MYKDTYVEGISILLTYRQIQREALTSSVYFFQGQFTNPMT